MQALLDRRPILHSRDIEETRAFLSSRAIQLDLPGSPRDRAGFEVCYNGIYLHSLWLGFIRYGAIAAAHVQPTRGDYWVHFPLHGRLSVATAGEVHDCDPRHAALTSPVDVLAITSDARTARLSISIHGEALMRHLAGLLDDAPLQPLRFAPSLALETGFGRFFAHMLRDAAEDFCQAAALAHPLAGNDFEQLVMTSLLLSHPHNYSAALRRRGRRVSPRDVRRAVDYIRENAGKPLTLGELAQASGVAGRTLLKHFHDAHGVSPMRYLRDHRLRLVREELLAGGAGSVSEAAARWGFAHFGRFSIEYRRRFGESPSATLARSRH